VDALQIPAEVISTGRQLLVRFKTDDTINWKGFSAAFVLAARDAQPATPSVAGLGRRTAGAGGGGSHHGPRSKTKSVGGGHHAKKTGAHGGRAKPPRRYFASRH